MPRAKRTYKIWYHTVDDEYIYLGMCQADSSIRAKDIIQIRVMQQKHLSAYRNTTSYVTVKKKKLQGA